ncbi:MAG: type II secretion system protein N [Pseudomonadota bacterium]
MTVSKAEATAEKIIGSLKKVTGLPFSGHQPLDAFRGISEIRLGRTAIPAKKIALIIEYLLSAAIAVLLALIVYSIIAPLPIPERLPVSGAPAQSAVKQEVLENANPFRNAAVAAGGAAAAVGLSDSDEEALEETTLNLVLHGVRVDQNNQTAIIRLPNGQQKTFRVGDELIPGVTLNDAYQDQVTITRRGVRETLTLVNRDPKVARANRNSRRVQTNVSTASSANSRVSKTIASRDFSEFIQVSPFATKEGIRLVLNPGKDSTLFTKSGLKPGDVLLEVDGRSVTGNPESIISTFQGLNPGNEIEISVERNEQFIPLIIQLPVAKVSEEKSAE